jgi:hypothetical protein
MTEPINSVLLVLAGALLGATAANCWACWVERWRWRRTWRGLAGRQERAFTDEPSGHAARFLAHSAELRTQARARELARMAKVNS